MDCPSLTNYMFITDLMSFILPGGQKANLESQQFKEEKSQKDIPKMSGRDRVLSEDEVKQAVCRHCHTDDVTIQEYQLLPFSENPLGFLGIHFKVVGQAKVRDKIENFQYFAKKMPDIPTHKDYAQNNGAFFKEIQFYETLVEDINKNLTGAHRKWCPEFLFSRNDDIVVCEDLTVSNYYMHPERTMMSLEYVLASVKAMAAMHAAPLILMAKLEAGTAPHPPPNWRPGQPADLALLYNHILYETEATDIPGRLGNTFYRAGIQSQVHVVDLLPGYTKEARENIKKHLPDVMYRVLELVKPSKKYRNTFVQGDLWSNNVMFADDEKGQVKDAIIIDFQLARYAPPCQELVMFIHLVQDRKFRQAHESTIINCYYDEFAKEVAAEGLDVQTILPKEELLESYKDYYEFAIITQTFFYQLSLAPSHVTAKFLSSPELFNHNFLVDRSEVVMETFRTDELCRTRMTESMNEIIEFYHLDNLQKWNDVIPTFKYSIG